MSSAASNKTLRKTHSLALNYDGRKQGFWHSQAKIVRPNLTFKQNPNKKEHDATKEYPSLAQQAKNLAETARDVARDPRWVDDEEFERRMTLCRACPLYDKKQTAAVSVAAA